MTLLNTFLQQPASAGSGSWGFLFYGVIIIAIIIFFVRGKNKNKNKNYSTMSLDQTPKTVNIKPVGNFNYGETLNINTMNYKVKPFIAKLSSKGSAADVASQVESFISQEASDGWEFVSCGNIDTQISGSNGCFGIGATPGSSTSIMVLVFKK